LLSEIPFGAFLVYSPRGTSPVSVRSRRVRDGIKAGRDEILRAAIEYLLRDFEGSGLSAVLGRDVSLVPCPRSSPLVSGALWPPRWVAAALVAAGLGREVVSCLERTEAVPKSAFQQPGARPTARRHYETIRVNELPLTGERVTIVDDFLTKGNTLLGAASRLAEARPRAAISAFALVRTLGRQPEIERIVDPCVGVIELAGEEGVRKP